MSAYFVLNRHCSPRLRLHISWFANVGKYCVGLCPTVNIGKIKDISINPLGNNRRQRRSKNIFRGIKMGIEPIWGINSLSPFILSWCITPRRPLRQRKRRNTVRPMRIGQIGSSTSFPRMVKVFSFSSSFSTSSLSSSNCWWCIA